MNFRNLKRRIDTMTDLELHRRALTARQAAIRSNASRRMRGLPPLPVPDKPQVPMVPVAYETDGTYAGRLERPEDCPPGCVVKMEAAR